MAARFFCVTHQSPFSTADGVQSPECRHSGRHILGKDFPADPGWAYCVSCDVFFSRSQADAGDAHAPRRCPACSATFARAYQCDSCGVLSLASAGADGGRRIALEKETGRPLPACPGCGNVPRGKPLPHADRTACPGTVHLDYRTARAACPFCSRPVAPQPQAAVAVTPAPAAPAPTPAPAPAPAPAPPPVRATAQPAAPAARPGLFAIPVLPAPSAPPAFDPAPQTPVPGRAWTPVPQAATQAATPPPARAASGVTTPVPTRAPAVAASGGSAAHPVPVPAEEPAAATKPPVLSGSSGNAVVFLGLAAVIVLLVVGTLTVVWPGYSFLGRVKAALAEDRIFAPAGDCVDDIFLAYRRKNPRSSKLAEAAALIRPRVEPPAQELIQRWYKDAEPDGGPDWELLSRSYALLEACFPGDAGIRGRRAYCQAERKLKQGDYSQALALYQESLGAVPGSALPLNGIAKVYVKANDEARAIASYEKASQADPAFTWSRKNLGELYALKGDWAHAEVYLRDALKTSPERASILRSLGNAVYRQARYEEALDLLRRSVAAEKDPLRGGKTQKLIAEVETKARKAGALN